MWADADENARIMESVKNETEAENKDLSPDGLAYHVSNMELEVERYVSRVLGAPYHAYIVSPVSPYAIRPKRVMPKGDTQC